MPALERAIGDCPLLYGAVVIFLPPAMWNIMSRVTKLLNDLCEPQITTMPRDGNSSSTR